MKRFLKNLIPKSWFPVYSALKNSNKSPEQVFTDIYKKKLWGEGDNDADYFSGTGTHDLNTLKYIEVLCGFIQKHDVKSVFEIGCGDFSIMKRVLAKAQIDYTGADVVLGLVNHLQKQETNQHTRFIHLDAIKNEHYPNADLCVIRQVLQHLSNAQITQILQKTKKFKYVMVTEHLPVHPALLNGDKSIGGYIRLQNLKTSGVFLDAPPFSLNCNTILSYRKDGDDSKGNISPALMVTSLITNS